MRRNDGGVRVPGMWGSAVSAPLRPGHTPLTSFAPPYAGAKGATDSCLRSVDSCLRRNDGWGSRNDGGVRVPGMWGSAVPAPLRPGHTPLVRTILVRAPFVGDERGRVSALCRIHPGHPPLTSLRSFAPPYAEAKGAFLPAQ